MGDAGLLTEDEKCKTVVFYIMHSIKNGGVIT